LSSIYKIINSDLKKKVNEFGPDIIWVFKGMEIMPETLKWAKSRGIKLVNYNPDNPFIFTGKGSGNMNVVNSIPLYDLHFTYNHNVANVLKEKFNARTEYLPFGFDVDDRLFKKCAIQKERIKLCFIGNPDSGRAEFIKQLCEKGIEIDIYGNDWKRFVKHRLANIFGPVYDEQLWVLLRTYRIQLNLMRVHNIDAHNMRTFEVPGIGGVMLAPRTSEHIDFFDDRKEVFYFHDIDECAIIVREILNMEEQRVTEIRNAARDRSIKSGYSYFDRSQFVLKCLIELND
jgi:spore maturation protein CgeB